MNEHSIDKFGGYNDIQFEATGFFRLERADRWWFVTPEGHAFLSFGVNHIVLRTEEDPGSPPLLREETLDFWADKFEVKDEDKRNYLAYVSGLRSKVEKDLKAFGMNTLGVHSPNSYYSESFMPYVQRIGFTQDLKFFRRPQRDKFPDVFSKEFESLCDNMAKKIALPRKKDPFLLGYVFADVPILTEMEALPIKGGSIWYAPLQRCATWPSAVKNLDKNAPGKREYVKLMRERYDNDIEHFNHVYQTVFESFSDLENAVDWRIEADLWNGRELDDNKAFLSKILDKCYRVEIAAVKKYDPNHLIFGDKLNAHGSTTVSDYDDYIVSLAAEHTDLIFYQLLPNSKIGCDPIEVLDRWSRKTEKPFFLGDSAYGVKDEKMPNVVGLRCKDQEERAEYFYRDACNLFTRPNFVGWNWCGWMDSSLDIEPNGLQHSGLQTAYGEYHEPMRKKMSEFSKKMYDIANG